MKTVLLCAIAFLLIVAVIVFCTWYIPPWLVTSPYDRNVGFPTGRLMDWGLSLLDILKAQNDLRHSIIETLQVVATAATAAGLVFTLYFTARNVQISDKNVRIAETNSSNAAQAALDNLQAQREARIGERFSKAIEQLSSTSCPVRVGAIKALARIARESREDHWPVVELLCAYLREQRPAGQSEIEEVAAPPEDAKAIATFIRTRRHDYENPELEHKIDLSLINLHGLIFDKTIFVNANLSDAEIEGTRFRGANFNGATLVNVKAGYSDFSGANLIDATLNGADLTAAFINDADFTNAHMVGVNLSHANVTGAVFRHTEGPILNVTREQISAASTWEVTCRLGEHGTRVTFRRRSQTT